MSCEEGLTGKDALGGAVVDGLAGGSLLLFIGVDGRVRSGATDELVGEVALVLAGVGVEDLLGLVGLSLGEEIRKAERRSRRG